MIYYIKYIIKHFLDIPKTIWFNFRYFDLGIAVRLPVLISRKVKIGKMYRGAIKIESNSNIRTFMIKIGVEGVEGVSTFRNGYLLVSSNSKIVFKGRANLSKGVMLRVTKGELRFGANVYSNCNLSVVCGCGVTIGDDCLLGWDICIRDCDGHAVVCDGRVSNESKQVLLGNHVWVGAHVDLLKGSIVGDGSVVGYGSCVTRPYPEANCLIGGYPARVIRRHVEWRA